MTRSRLQAETEKFVAKLEGLLADTVGVDAQFKLSAIGDGTVLAVKPVSFHNRQAPGFPLVRDCDDPDTPVLFLRVLYSVEMDTSDAFLQVVTSTIGLWIDVTAGQKHPRPFVRVEYDRRRRTAPAHVHLHANSPELAWVYGSGGRPAPDLHALHFPVGGRRFRPTLEEFLIFLNDEDLYIDWKQGWKPILEQSLRQWELLQARSTARNHPEEAAHILENLGYQIVPPSPSNGNHNRLALA